MHKPIKSEPDIAAVFNRAIQPGDTVLDIGANVGVFVTSVLASHLVGPDGCVVAFEPAPENLERLARNLALNSITNVKVVEPAGQQPDRRNVVFHLNSDNDGRHSLSPTSDASVGFPSSWKQDAK